MRFRTTLGLVATVVLTAATGLVATVSTAGPAAAAECRGASGVTVVVDFNSLGGGVQGACVDHGGRASSLFTSAGFPLKYAQRQQGFVCRVSGVPASDPCTNTAPANAYWGLWWSDGRNGRWSYSSLGATSLNVPEGGYVAFSYDDGPGRAEPSYAAAARVEPEPPPEPEPSPEPTPDPTREPPEESPEPSATPSAEPTDEPTTEEPSASPSPSRTPKPKPKPSTSAAPSEPPATTPGDDEIVAELADPEPPREAADADDDGLPGWLAPALIVLLFGGAGGVLLLRRRNAGG